MRSAKRTTNDCSSRRSTRPIAVALGSSDTWHRTESAEESLRISKGAKVKKDHALWIPSLSFVQALKRSGAVSGGRPVGAGAWDEAKEMVGGALEGATYSAGLLVGILEGAWNAVVDLFKGAVEMIETVGKTVFYALSGDLGAIKKMATDLIDKLEAAWGNRGAIADAFLAKWNDPDAWTRGNFQGEVLGWVMMTVLLVLLTMGESAIATALGSSAWGARFLAAIRTADALGDVTTYARGLSRTAKLPKRSGGIGDELAPGNASLTARGNAKTATPHGDKTPGRDNEMVTIEGLGQSPRLTWAKNADGAVRSIDEAIEIARENGLEIPDDVLLRKVAGKVLPPNTLARYFSKRAAGKDLISWQQFYDDDLDSILVSIDSSVFSSDEAIVAVLTHEMYELNKLRGYFEASNGHMKATRAHELINPGIKGNPHDQAWDEADKAVANMRKKKSP